jgi:hypothetical protein
MLAPPQVARGFLAGIVRKKLKLNLISERSDDVRVYRKKKAAAPGCLTNSVSQVLIPDKFGIDDARVQPEHHDAWLTWLAAEVSKKSFRIATKINCTPIAVAPPGQRPMVRWRRCGMCGKYGKF